MTRVTRVHRWPLLAAVVVGLGSLLAGVVWLESRSAERANRLVRTDRPSDAAALYRLRLAAAPGAELLHYNLGTTLLGLGALDEAEAEIRRALDASDSLVAFRARFNLGHHYLVEAVSHPVRDTAEVLARAAVDLSRDAVRRAPDSDDARWNLALAQRALDSLLWLESGVDEETVRDSLAAADPDAALPALLRELQQQSGSLGGHFFTRGEREALARDLADAPLTAEEAGSILAGMDQSPEQVLQRIFRLASPNRWGAFGTAGRRAW